VQVRLRFFASLRECLGSHAVRTVPEGATAGTTWEAIARETPAVRRTRVRFAINERYVDADEPLADGDELAFFPPVSGG
jgi:molybdopterin synthase sulfur carrier subunit